MVNLYIIPCQRSFNINKRGGGWTTSAHAPYVALEVVALSIDCGIISTA
jgi:hypothetical protein